MEHFLHFSTVCVLAPRILGFFFHRISYQTYTHHGSGNLRGNLNRYTKRPLQDSGIIFSTSGWGNLRFAVQITGFPANVSNPQDILTSGSLIFQPKILPKNFIEEWARQTKPKKGQFMNFSQGHSFFPKEKYQNSQKWAKFMNFSFWPFLWFGLPGRLLIYL